jgi:leucyl aminopeptidase
MYVGTFLLYGESMELMFEKHFEMRDTADVLVVPFWQSEGAVRAASFYGDYQERIDPLIDLGDFKAKEQEVVLFYEMQGKEQRLLLLGLGSEDQLTLETIRRSAAEAVKYAMSKRAKTLNFLVPQHAEYSADQIAYAIAESALMTNYRFDYMSAKQDKQPALLEKVCLIVDGCHAEEILKEVFAISRGMKFTKDLVNGNADEITPKILAERALELGKKYKSVQVSTLDKHAIQKEGMGLFYAVARSSSQEPYFIVVRYQGHPSSHDHTVLIGKGITYDTGGLSLKTSPGMETMRSDMAGAATVLGTLVSAAELNMPINLSCVIAATENSIGPTSFKLGDVYTAYNKTTVEIKNTDAEGRLALADCLSYAVAKLAPTRMIDLATLTGAAEVALGNNRSPFFSNHDGLAEALFESGEAVGERLWLMPLDPDYRELITSRVADLKNSGAREGSLIFSGMFLKEFVGDIPWVHVDIAGTAFLAKPRYYHTTCATAYGIRLLIHYLKKHHGKG